MNVLKLIFYVTVYIIKTFGANKIIEFMILIKNKLIKKKKKREDLWY